MINIRELVFIRDFEKVKLSHGIDLSQQAHGKNPWDTTTFSPKTYFVGRGPRLPRVLKALLTQGIAQGCLQPEDINHQVTFILSGKHLWSKPRNDQKKKENQRKFKKKSLSKNWMKAENQEVNEPEIPNAPRRRKGS